MEDSDAVGHRTVDFERFLYRTWWVLWLHTAMAKAERNEVLLVTLFFYLGMQGLN